MANNCPVCMANLDLVGRAHNCRPISFGEKLIASAKEGREIVSTYQYRNADSRRAYMRDYMRKKRNAV